jgi:hypothetical protein
MRAPILAVGDGALGSWDALREVFPEIREQRCWFHKIANVLSALEGPGRDLERRRPRARPPCHRGIQAGVRRQVRQGRREDHRRLDQLLAFCEHPTRSRTRCAGHHRRAARHPAHRMHRPGHRLPAGRRVAAGLPRPSTDRLCRPQTRAPSRDHRGQAPLRPPYPPPRRRRPTAPAPRPPPRRPTRLHPPRPRRHAHPHPGHRLLPPPRLHRHRPVPRRGIRPHDLQFLFHSSSTQLLRVVDLPVGSRRFDELRRSDGEPQP